jgi:predicted GNAT family acetyltransferase
LAVLDNPVWSALTGPQRDLGRSTALVGRFDPGISPFGAFSGSPSAAHWAELADLLGAGGSMVVVGRGELLLRPPEGWTVPLEMPGVQMLGDQLHPVAAKADRGPIRLAPFDEVIALDAADVPEMMDLVAVAKPGPFLERTIEFGGYIGIRRQGRLVAMAGERMHPAGYAEISAVATHPDHRGQGLAELLVRAVAAGIVERGEIPILHASADNERAIRLYRAMGFTVARQMSFALVRVPADGKDGD